MGTTIFRNEENLNNTKVLQLFGNTLKKHPTFPTNEVDELAEAYSKNIADKFIVSDTGLDDTFGRQGDILFWKEGSEMYEQEFPRVKHLKETDRKVLQPGDSMTGDHRLIPLPNSHYKIQEGEFIPSFLEGHRTSLSRPYSCIIFETDKSFLVFHREHGNIALTAGKYMICSQMDPATLSWMID